MAIAVSYEIENDREFNARLTELGTKASDLRIPLTLIAKDFFKSQKAIWALKSPGKYPDLAASTKAQRRRDGQSMYPILFRTGALMRSMTNPSDGNAINQIINKRELILGTKVKSKKGFNYPAVHQFGSKHVPMRKFLFIGPEAPRFALGPQKGRLERWIGIIEGYMKALLEARRGG